MSYQNSYSTEERITKFLRSHPDAPVRVVVGYASVWGLAWLHRHTRGRRVHLLIGDMRKHHFDRASDRDKQQALKFLARPDVEISNWCQKKPQPSEARIKAWMIESPGKVAVLTGTANLTKKGIQYNRELMMEPSGKDLNYAVSTIKRLFVNSWDCRDKLSRHITSSNSAPSPSTITEPAKRATQRRTDYNAAAAEIADSSGTRAPTKTPLKKPQSFLSKLLRAIFSADYGSSNYNRMRNNQRTRKRSNYSWAYNDKRPTTRRRRRTNNRRKNYNRDNFNYSWAYNDKEPTTRRRRRTNNRYGSNYNYYGRQNYNRRRSNQRRRSNYSGNNYNRRRYNQRTRRRSRGYW